MWSIFLREVFREVAPHDSAPDAVQAVPAEGGCLPEWLVQSVYGLRLDSYACVSCVTSDSPAKFKTLVLACVISSCTVIAVLQFGFSKLSVLYNID